jgi:hypothetical protein
MTLDLLAAERRVDRRVTHERHGAQLDEHVVDGGLHVALGEPLDELLAERERLAHVGRDAELEDRRRPCLGEPPRDRLPNGRQLNDLDLRLRHRDGRG